MLQIDSTRPTRGATNCQLRLRLSDEWSILRSCAQGAVCAWSFHCAHGRQHAGGNSVRTAHVQLTHFEYSTDSTVLVQRRQRL